MYTRLYIIYPDIGLHALMPIMRFTHLLFLSILSVSALTACSSEEPVKEQSQTSPRYVKLATVSNIPDYDEFTFPAVVSAVKTVDLSFEVSGRLIQTDLVTGSDISKGKLLATIDRKPFERRVDESKTRLEQAKRELDRIEKMFAQKLVAQSSLDSAKTSYELAVIDLKNAEQDLSYTQLYAPFDAKVSQRLVENNSFVAAGTPIARLQDVSKIYFNINVPERLLTANIGRGIKQASATLATNRSQWYPVNYVEHSTQPDPVSQTYEVVFAMEPREELPLTPGARAVVKVSLQGSLYPEGLVVPVRSLVGNADAGFSVWVYNEASNSVTKQTVEVKHIEDELAIIESNGQSNLTLGQKVVAAGATQMRANMKVLPYQGEK
ncbi:MULTISPECIES: efflux RND transporter periplasmic adaptor subunit [Alteromonas]|uniref:efflux RND transporter periplasmic adaptor subunit n=1 Tax=Alteromonas TaxID=226 RepID=UPI0002988ACA|nr:MULTISPECIES: efflux RND transporter periplasmic adaptor subunit [Alteromonas]AGP93067.1 multidrug resistance protein [Alteromonas mediterranea U8]MEA3379636.1 efflux RND transporter periplasmic adaptor subunit [Pseudomonadota bacterium]AFV84925.1 putative multidrug resistance protein [Alteromonas mediterranea DE1]AGP85063.1 multidrug resistance protein [Alteromonas mediterranea U4]AGP89194.1 multidrug resistance protein [Alteromonas mediterranea U7]